MFKEKKQDEYNWEVYTKEYSEQIKTGVSAENDLLITDFKIKNHEIEFKDNLHPNWLEIYHRVIDKNINSVLECGCGSCQHLLNIHTIRPDLMIRGIDLLQSQIDFGTKYFNIDDSFLKNISVLDFTENMAYKKLGNTYDLVYSQTVMTHLCNENVNKFLNNMIMASNKYILLIERTDMDYMTIISDLKKSMNIKLKVENTTKYLDTGILITKL